MSAPSFPAARLLAGLVLLGTVIASAGTSSAAGLPAVLRESSVQNGWTSVDSAVSARYSRSLRPESSRADLVDVNGTPVTGQVKVNINTITFTPEITLQNEHGPFTITFSVLSAYQKADEAPTVDTIRFQVDVHAPYPPRLSLPLTTVEIPDFKDRAPGYNYLWRFVVSDPTQPLEIEGTVREAGHPAIFDWSGIARIQVRFFDRNGEEVPTYRKDVAVDCSEGCPFEPAFRVAADTVPNGYWTARVGAYDLAGNRSADSESVSFVVAR